MRTILKITIIILTLTIVGCKKDDDGNQSDQNLKLVTYSIDAGEYNINYDDNGKPTSIETSSGLQTIIYNTNNQIIQIGSFFYSYNSQGRLSQFNYQNSISDNEGELVYNSQGQLEVMNFISISGSNTRYITSNYNYDAQGRLSEIIESSDDISGIKKTEITYDSNNNIVQERYLVSNDGINFQLYYTKSYTYDNKKNPYKQLASYLGIEDSISNYYFFGFESVSLFPLSFISNNNILTEVYISSSGTSSKQYTYSYNEGNYPVACDFNYTDSEGYNYTEYYNWTYETY